MRSTRTLSAEQRADPHARSTLVRPLDWDDLHRVAAAAREVDDLGVEDDAADPLASEKVVRGVGVESP